MPEDTDAYPPPSEDAIAEASAPQEDAVGPEEGPLMSTAAALHLTVTSPVVTSPEEAALHDADAGLVARAKAGDQRAFAALYDRHHGRVFAMCTRLLRDRAEVEDAVQHAFMEAWRCLHRFEGRSRFSTWITRIAIHTSLGFRRRLRRLFFTDDLPALEGRSERAPTWSNQPMSPDEGAVHGDRKRALHQILQALSAKKRVVFVLAELEGCTAPEIAKVLEIPDATVRTRLFHARKDFAKLVRDHPGFADLFANESASEFVRDFSDGAGKKTGARKGNGKA